MLFIKATILYFFFSLYINTDIHGQTVSGKLKFEKGATLVIDMQIKSSVTQQVGDNAIDFSADGSATHSYKVTNVTPGSTTLHHEAQKIRFNFEGMGQKRSFDSDDEKDMAGQFGEPAKNILSKKFDVTIDQNGTVLAARPEKKDSAKADERLILVMNMLKDITDVVYPPKKGEPGFFKVLPAAEKMIGESWTDSLQNETGKFKTTYTLSGITDSTILVDFNGTVTTVVKAMMMGREAVTTMNGTSIGRIILDKTTGIVKEKTINTESNGNTEALGGTVPVTAKSTITIHVKPG
ncbi:MAG: DUF6263 family protein [Chitinophagaceae bacterium]